jgi:hypothetical protein
MKVIRCDPRGVEKVDWGFQVGGRIGTDDQTLSGATDLRHEAGAIQNEFTPVQ